MKSQSSDEMGQIRFAQKFKFSQIIGHYSILTWAFHKSDAPITVNSMSASNWRST